MRIVSLMLALVLVWGGVASARTCPTAVARQTCCCPSPESAAEARISRACCCTAEASAAAPSTATVLESPPRNLFAPAVPVELFVGIDPPLPAVTQPPRSAPNRGPPGTTLLRLHTLLLV